MNIVDAGVYVDEELMALHNRYHNAIKDESYVTVGSIIGCTYGSILAKLSANQVSEVYVGNGAPVLTCSDCASGINIPTFGTCTCPASTRMGMPGRRLGTWGSANGASGGTYTPYGYKCIPLIDQEWEQPKGTALIWRVQGGQYSYALKSNGILVCRYGGIIGVIEVNTGETKGSSKEYVTLEQLDDFGFFMGNTDTERQISVKELNRVLETYAITTELRISFFMGQVKHESRKGERTLESFSGASPEVYFNNKYSNMNALGNQGGNDGELFRGSGYIHLTGRYNYQKFANYVGDQQIMTDGYRLVGGVYNRPIQNISASDVGVIDIGKYAWESCGWFWNRGNPKTTDLNTYADIKDWHSISSAINQYDTATFPTRNKYINEFYNILTGQNLGLPE